MLYKYTDLKYYVVCPIAQLHFQNTMESFMMYIFIVDTYNNIITYRYLWFPQKGMAADP